MLIYHLQCMPNIPRKLDLWLGWLLSHAVYSTTWGWLPANWYVSSLPHCTPSMLDAMHNQYMSSPLHCIFFFFSLLYIPDVNIHSEVSWADWAVSVRQPGLWLSALVCKPIIPAAMHNKYKLNLSSILISPLLRNSSVTVHSHLCMADRVVNVRQTVCGSLQAYYGHWNA
jgi:hypothetical protein